MEWISVKDRKPDEELKRLREENNWGDFGCIKVIASCKTWNHSNVVEYDGEFFWTLDSYMIDDIISHWMPMPEPPKEVYQ